MRGRKKKDGAYRKLVSIRLTEEQKDIIDKNEWIKKEIDNIIRTYLDTFIQKK